VDDILSIAITQKVFTVTVYALVLNAVSASKCQVARSKAEQFFSVQYIMQ